ncbi:MAG TPA: NAD(P)/FAD-dependent oxidoreductase [Acidisarcina sp.]|nr:NAD(P)/FAD-dependent oxidoreductase [Acidisarcina sp.]
MSDSQIPNCAEVLVVGGGPAGLSAAIALRQRGVDVVVVDALRPPIDKACGEGLMPDSRGELASLGISLGPADGKEFRGIHFANRNSGRTDCVTAQFANGAGLGVRRVRLHEALIERALALGVQLRWGVHVELRQRGEVQVDGRPCAYGYLVGADGQASGVRRWARLEAGSTISRRFGFRRHFRVRPWSENVEVHWGACGQAYVTPVGEEELCVATIASDPQVRMVQVVDSIPYLREALRGQDTTSQQRGAITTTRRLRCVARDRVALIGDASGSADAITGEGLAMVFRQAQLLADAIEVGNLSHYAAGHPAILHLPMTMARMMLLMDRWPLFRNRAMRVLASEPALFSRLLEVHMGAESLPRFVRQDGLHLGWRMLVPSAART